ncbi:MAG: PAS domain S-box protein [Gallionellaceae bacterium]|jgi:two-component system sensor histidine kinase UhpB
MNLAQSALRVLLVEDSPDDADLTIFELSESGFEIAHTRVESETEMRIALQSANWDVVISDFNLPKFNTRSALAVLREMDTDVPFIIVSGCIGEESAVTLMKEGASDFVMKDKLGRLPLVIERELRDATLRREHRQAQEALRANEKLLREITATVGEGIYVLNEFGHIVFMNPEAERLLGWKKQELSGRNVHNTIHPQKPDGTPLPEKDCGAYHVMESGGVYRSDDEIFVRKNGTLMPVSFVASAIMQDGKAVASVTAFQDISQRKQAEQELRESRKQLRELSAYLQSVREEERSRIARELHDELGQMLTGIKLDANWLINQLPAHEPAVERKSNSLTKLINETMDAMRRTAADLRPVMLDDLGLAAAVEWLSEDFTERTTINVQLALGKAQCKHPCSWECASQWDDNLNDAVATAAFRIVQESLTNIARHAHANRVMISITCKDGNLLLLVSDDGQGIETHNVQKPNSYGVIGMRERAHSLGGIFDLSSIPGEGTTVQAVIPLSPPHISGALQ